MSWNYWTDSELPDSIRRDLLPLRTVDYGTPEDHGVSHTKDSHTYTLYALSWNGFAVKVHHGAGIRWLVTIHEQTSALFIRNAHESLSASKLWELLDLLFVVFEDGAKKATDRTSREYREAFAEGRLKKRKLRNQSACKVWIEPKARTNGDETP